MNMCCCLCVYVLAKTSRLALSILVYQRVRASLQSLRRWRAVKNSDWLDKLTDWRMFCSYCVLCYGQQNIIILCTSVGVTSHICMSLSPLNTHTLSLSIPFLLFISHTHTHTHTCPPRIRTPAWLSNKKSVASFCALDCFFFKANVCK